MMFPSSKENVRICLACRNQVSSSLREANIGSMCSDSGQNHFLHSLIFQVTFAPLANLPAKAGPSVSSKAGFVVLIER